MVSAENTVKMCRLVEVEYSQFRSAAKSVIAYKRTRCHGSLCLQRQSTTAIR